MLHAPTFVLDAVGSHCTEHGHHTAFRFGSGDVLRLFSGFEECVQTAHVHDQSVPQRFVLHVQSQQPTLYVVLNVDACNLHGSQALLVQQLVGLGLAQAFDYLHVFQRTVSCRTRSRVQFQEVTSPVLQAFTISGVATQYDQEKQRRVAVLFRATGQVYVHDKRFRLRVLHVVRRLLVQLVTALQHDWLPVVPRTERKYVGLARLSPHLRVIHSVLRSLHLGRRVSGQPLPQDHHVQRDRRHCSFPAGRCGLGSLCFA